MVADDLEKPAEGVETVGDRAQRVPTTTATISDDGASSTTFHYFSYGSNLLTERIHVHIPDAMFLARAMLSDYELVFCAHSELWNGAVASIKPKQGAYVWGCVWSVPNSFGATLDAQEHGYHRMNVNVRVASAADPSTLSSSMLCRTYQFTSPPKEPQLPSPHYKQVIVEGAKQHHLPSEYVKLLEKERTNDFRGRITLELEVIRYLNNNSAENAENVQQQQRGQEQQEKRKGEDDVVVAMEEDEKTTVVN